MHLKRTLRRDYPNLAGLFILLRVMNLYEADENRLRANPSALAVWRDLNPTEQEFALLEALLFQARSSVRAEERGGREDAGAFDGLTLFLSQLTERWHTFQEHSGGGRGLARRGTPLLAGYGAPTGSGIHQSLDFGGKPPSDCFPG